MILSPFMSSFQISGKDVEKRIRSRPPRTELPGLHIWIPPAPNFPHNLSRQLFSLLTSDCLTASTGTNGSLPTVRIFKAYLNSGLKSENIYSWNHVITVKVETLKKDSEGLTICICFKIICIVTDDMKK